MGSEKKFEEDRKMLVEKIFENFADDMSKYLNADIDSETIKTLRSAFLKVPRHKFFLDEHISKAYENTAVDIGHGQTISQPSLVATMIALINPKESKRILDVGTGSGYQAAILSACGCQVIGVEIVKELAIQAKERMDNLGFDNVKIIHGNVREPLEEQGMFEGILVAATSEDIPNSLIDRLEIGGKLIIPVGKAVDLGKIKDEKDPNWLKNNWNKIKGKQMLTMVTKMESGLETKDLCEVMFVPLIDGEA